MQRERLHLHLALLDREEENAQEEYDISEAHRVKRYHDPDGFVQSLLRRKMDEVKRLTDKYNGHNQSVEMTNRMKLAKKKLLLQQQRINLMEQLGNLPA